MTEEWHDQLRCPNCHKTGTAGLSQGESDKAASVLSVPEGFKVVQTEYGPDFQCAAGNVAVLP